MRLEVFGAEATGILTRRHELDISACCGWACGCLTYNCAGEDNSDCTGNHRGVLVYTLSITFHGELPQKKTRVIIINQNITPKVDNDENVLVHDE